ncbi:MAG: site-2 protease family protein, partial [Planctomycetota bacterium]
IKHIDPIMTIALPAFLWFVVPLMTGGDRFIFGGAKPVPVVPDRLKSRHRDMAIVAVAGPLMNFALAFLCLALHKALQRWTGLDSSDALSSILRQGAFYNVLLGAFNLLPIPPLDGSRVVAYLLPASIRPSYVALERMGLLLVVAFVFVVPGTQDWLFARIYEAYDGLATSVEWLFALGKGK